MTTLQVEILTMPAAELGPENPLAPLAGDGDLHVVDRVDAAVPADMRQNIHYGRLANILPYSLQDGYTRERQQRDFRTAVLENDTLRAVFLLEYGGRLWSLLHKPSGRELLSVNPVFQPANLALRNAWFSGGVEWNIGTIGHSPFTCAPLFAARLAAPNGTPILRLYEWERIRQVTFQIDVWLPDDSPVLFVHVSIHNRRDCEVPMYWWSNIAVPETPATRVLAPANTAYHFTYEQLNVIPVPEYRSVDHSYPTNIDHAVDFFYHIPDERLPWITALDGSGQGLFQLSTPRLKGRKLFVWGMGKGGRKWQEFLSVPGQAYIEIQAGLARTQLEHVPMPANSCWDWLEAYGLLQADPTVIHGADWDQATSAAGTAIEKLIPHRTLEAERERSLAWADLPAAEMLQTGSSWGALEQQRRAAAGQAPLALHFDSYSLGAEQQPWLDLLHSGYFPAADAQPGAGLVQAEWQALLERDPKHTGNWQAMLHLGLMKYSQDDRDGARQAWLASQVLSPNPWALRNLAVLDGQENHPNQAAEHYLRACRMAPDLLPLAVECGKFLTTHGFASQWLDLLDDLPLQVRSKGRIRLLEAVAALDLGQSERAGAIIASLPIIDDLREGELSLSLLWDEYQAQRLALLENLALDDKLRARARHQYPLPEWLDFRMKDGG